MGNWGNGTVQIIPLENLDVKVQFFEVKIANEPDLYVYLSNKSSFTGISDIPGDFINLGRLPYNQGNFSFGISLSINLEDVNSVLIWCL